MSEDQKNKLTAELNDLFDQYEIHVCREQIVEAIIDLSTLSKQLGIWLGKD